LGHNDVTWDGIKGGSSREQKKDETRSWSLELVFLLGVLGQK